MGMILTLSQSLVVWSINTTVERYQNNENSQDALNLKLHQFLVSTLSCKSIPLGSARLPLETSADVLSPRTGRSRALLSLDAVGEPLDSKSTRISTWPKNMEGYLGRAIESSRNAATPGSPGGVALKPSGNPRTGEHASGASSVSDQGDPPGKTDLPSVCVSG